MGKIKSEQEVYNDTSGKTAIYQGVQPWQKKRQCWISIAANIHCGNGTRLIDKSWDP